MLLHTKIIISCDTFIGEVKKNMQLLRGMGNLSASTSNLNKRHRKERKTTTSCAIFFFKQTNERNNTCVPT